MKIGAPLFERTRNRMALNEDEGHDIAVLPVMQIAQICIMQLVRKEADHMILRHPLRGVDGRHESHILERFA